MKLIQSPGVWLRDGGLGIIVTRPVVGVPEHSKIDSEDTVALRRQRNELSKSPADLRKPMDQ